jgi:hypothetical protein
MRKRSDGKVKTARGSFMKRSDEQQTLGGNLAVRFRMIGGHRFLVQQSCCIRIRPRLFIGRHRGTVGLMRKMRSRSPQSSRMSAVARLDNRHVRTFLLLLLHGTSSYSSSDPTVKDCLKNSFGKGLRHFDRVMTQDREIKSSRLRLVFGSLF